MCIRGDDCRDRIRNSIPMVGVKRVADAPRDRPGLNVAVIDVPAIWSFGVPAAGEGGHAALKRSRGR